MLMATLDASRLWMGIHSMDVWSLEMLKVPSFFLYAADPLMLVAPLEGVILQDQILSDLAGSSFFEPFKMSTKRWKPRHISHRLFLLAGSRSLSGTTRELSDTVTSDSDAFSSTRNVQPDGSLKSSRYDVFYGENIGDDISISYCL
jgi:hypothetical protein